MGGKSKNYIEEYYNAIKSGEIVAGKWITLLYERIIKGLDEGEYSFDEEKAEEVINWIESHCYHTEGPLAPNQFKLALWQKAVLCILYGVVDDSGRRNFREVVLVMARKNGKSLFASAIAKYEWQQGGYGARVYCLAPKLDQTDIIYNSIWNQTTLDPGYIKFKEEIAASIKFHERKKIDDSSLPKHRMTDLYIASLNATVKKIAFSAKKSDGFNPSLTICDEIASWEGDKGLKQYEVMKSAGGAREMGESPPILLSCSTSGYINDSIYDELIKRSTRFLLGESKEKRLLPFLYMIDDLDKWNDIEELKKSNPNIGVSVAESFLHDEIAIAEQSASKKAEFMTKYCNIKQNSSLAWLSAQVVEKAYGEELTLEQFRGCYCVGGIDLSQTTDLTSACVVIEKNGQLYVFSKFWLPSERIQEATERDGIPYYKYINAGIMQLSGNNFVDYPDVYKWFVSLINDYEIYPLKVGYDRYSSQYLIQDMKTFGFHCDDVYQGWNLYPVLMEFEGLLKDGVIHAGVNDLLKIHMLNSAIKMDVEQNKGKLVKLNPMDHIDGMAALADAMTVRQKYYGEIGAQLKNED